MQKLTAIQQRSYDLSQARNKARLDCLAERITKTERDGIYARIKRDLDDHVHAHGQAAFDWIDCRHQETHVRALKQHQATLANASAVEAVK